ncbi:MAG: glycogen debranching protein [Candidatus Andersenbacteria bacterium CG10_big_fil_rev_8_21_14_0_10_54_11]|uniref:beta-fructofuranosidase n=1 Tax=Candidatus Andersenbacteria bacterium CG10_big_fil_rev_8_21_14_0_10_54_11 TaxID=1974485 RepID=A0A2M6X008_9BACT|nr:MAG: glycogen debranching protein [Candidatus Andersenbacteria bacterium CG10_big_fil_rev_8_21_14_0_10_54_11]
MTDRDLADEGSVRALDVLRAAATPDGFVAATTDRDNYRRVWARDGVITSLAALLTDDPRLHAAALATLRTLASRQGPQGQIASNVDPAHDAVSYGGTAGRVDASLWFVIGCHRWWEETTDEQFLREYVPVLERVEFVLAAWEFNAKGLLYVPETGDWADEFLQHGYILYDQLLYLRALRGLADMCAARGLTERSALRAEKAERLVALIRDNFWFYRCDPFPEHAYHPGIFQKGCEAAEHRGAYWMPYFSPTGYGYRFDAFANVMAPLLGAADADQAEATDRYIAAHVVRQDFPVLPAFSPVVQPVDADWKELQSTFSNTFKNKPYEFHNGGLWPLLNGFYAADLARRGKRELAERFLTAAHAANRLGRNGEEWGFYEFIHGQTLRPGGTPQQTWSAAAAVIGQAALDGRMPL